MSIPSYWSDQEETDSRVVLYSIFGAFFVKSHVKVKKADSHLFWFVQRYSRQINVPVFSDTGHGNKKRFFSVIEWKSHFSKISAMHFQVTRIQWMRQNDCVQKKGEGQASEAAIKIC